MCYVYILRNEQTDRYYIGSADNIDRRMKQHLNGTTRTTKVLGTKELVYIEEFDTILEARSRERKLKSYKSKKYIKLLIENSGPVAQW